MATTPFAVDRFGGLKLTPDPEELGANDAADLMNVDVWKPGRVSTRDGYTAFSTTPASAVNALLQTNTTGDVLVSETNKTWALNSSGTSITSLALQSGGMVNLGTASAPLTYLATGSVHKWDGAAFTLVTAAVDALRIAVTPWDNRVVAVGGSVVSFSDPGDGQTWGANNFVGVTPNDGEALCACVAWRELVFCFKQSRIFVFYGTSIDSAGNPIFAYRTIDAVGAVDTTDVSFSQTAAANRHGVFFIGRDGVYVTTGDVPQKVSGALDPWFRGETLPFSTLPAFGGYSAPAIGCVEDRVYMCPDTSTSLTFVFDIPSGEWSAYDWKMTACAPYGTGSSRRIPLIGIGSAGDLFKHSAAATSDNGSAISWRYASGLYDLGYPGQAKITLESRVWGTGTATLQVASDHGAFDTGSSLTLGTSPAVADAWQQIDREGVFLQHKLSGSGRAVVNRVAHYLSFVKPSGVA